VGASNKQPGAAFPASITSFMPRFIALLIGVVLVAGSARAQVMVSVRESTDTLVAIDTGSLSFTDIGPLGVSFEFGGMTWAPSTGTLYMVGGRGNNNLYSVNLSTGAATLIGSHGINDLFSIAYDSSTGTLYGAQFSGGTSLYTLDLNNGTATLLGNPGIGIGGMTYDISRNRLIGINDGSGDIYEINRADGSVSLLLSGLGNNDSGLAYDPFRDALWNIDWSGNLYYYDIANGYARTTLLSGLGSFDGLTFIAIPEPSTWVLLGFGTLILGIRARRRFRR